MSGETCPNGCDLATFGTHAGPPDCDLGPADPDAILATGKVPGPGGQLVAVEVPVAGPLAATLRADAVRGLSGRQEPVEFVQHVEPAVRVVGIPDTTAIPPEVMIALDDLARACRDAYGLGVEVEGGGDREDALLALETLRRYLA